MSYRPTVIIGNWKMHKTLAETRHFVSGLAPVVSQTSWQVGLAVPFTALAVAAEAARGTAIKIGAQNISDFDEGAYTGEISGKMLNDAGASFTLVGHSERRHLFHEDNALLNRKIKKTLEYGLQPVFCIGETLKEHQAGKAHDVLQKQLLDGFNGLTASQVENLVIAYEPVWAIGTNQAATPDLVQKTHVFCRECVAQKWGQKAADHVVIQYGGSVNPDNASAFLVQSDVDGLLVGGAALSLESFSKIVLVR